MSDRLTQSDLHAMQARCDAATKGPITVHKSSLNLTLCGHKVLSSPDAPPVAYCMDPVDAEFYAHARTDLPRALAEIRELRRERDEARRWTIARAADNITDHEIRLKLRTGDDPTQKMNLLRGDEEAMRWALHELAQLRAENERLKTKLNQVDDVLITNWITPPDEDGDYRKALADLIAVSISEHDDPAVSLSAKQCQDELTALRQQLAEAQQKNRELGEQLEFDRTAVADGMTAARKEIESRSWLLDGRGSYEWNDDRYRQEFGWAIEGIRKALEPLGAIAANWKDCPERAKDVATARIDLKRQLAEAQADKEQLRADMRSLATGEKLLVLWGSLGCLTDDCGHWDDGSCNTEKPHCRIGRTIDAARKETR